MDLTDSDLTDSDLTDSDLIDSDLIDSDLAAPVQFARRRATAAARARAIKTRNHSMPSTPSV